MITEDLKRFTAQIGQDINLIQGGWWKYIYKRR